MVYKWAKISLLYFFVVAFLGALLRIQLYFPVDGINFKNFLHAHSHTAFLGWVFNALYAALVYAFVPAKENTYKVLFLLLQVAVVGMLFSFPIQGYAAISITFSTLHIFFSYWFAIKFWRDANNNKRLKEHVSLKYVKWALFFMVLSSLGPFSLGGIMAKGLSDTNFYNLSIYFYLHFQYNGWFSFAVLGLLFWLLETYKINFSKQHERAFYNLMVIACIPSYALSTFWVNPPFWIIVLGFLSALLQVIALVYMGKVLLGARIVLLHKLRSWVYYMLCFSMAAFALKILLQFAAAFPQVADLAFRVRHFTIGYLHLVFIGFISVFLMAWFVQEGFFAFKRNSLKTGVLIFIIGFLGSEAIVVLQPLLIMFGFGIFPFGNEALLALSALMPLGLMVLILNLKNFQPHVLNRGL